MNALRTHARREQQEQEKQLHSSSRPLLAQDSHVSHSTRLCFGHSDWGGTLPSHIKSTIASLLNQGDHLCKMIPSESGRFPSVSTISAQHPLPPYLIWLLVSGTHYRRLSCSVGINLYTSSVAHRDKGARQYSLAELSASLYLLKKKPDKHI